jgi:5-methylcytosine-specific restriction endonuclease McrA
MARKIKNVDNPPRDLLDVACPSCGSVVTCKRYFNATAGGKYQSNRRGYCAESRGGCGQTVNIGADGLVSLQWCGARELVVKRCTGCDVDFNAPRGNTTPVCPDCMAYWDKTRASWFQRRVMYVECKNEKCDNLMAQRFRGEGHKPDNVYCSAYCAKLQGKRDHNRRTAAARGSGGQRRKRRKREDNLAIAFKHGYRCHLCGQLIDVSLPSNHKRALQIDHLIPVSDGGTDARENLAPAHAVCNQKRSAYGPAQLQIDHG